MVCEKVIVEILAPIAQNDRNSHSCTIGQPHWVIFHPTNCHSCAAKSFRFNCGFPTDRPNFLEIRANLNQDRPFYLKQTSSASH